MKLECWEELGLLGRTACSPVLLIPVCNSYLYLRRKHKKANIVVNKKKANIVPTTISAFSPVYRRMNAKEDIDIMHTRTPHAGLEDAPTTISFTPNSIPFNTWPWRSVNINSEPYLMYRCKLPFP
jgi:hypothetical protein